MPIPVAIGDIIECQYRYKLDGQQLINTFHYRSLFSNADASGTLDDLAEQFYTNQVAPILQLQSAEVTNAFVTIQVVYPTRYVQRTYVGELTVGQDINDALVSGGSMVIRRKSDRASRSARGRIYIGGFPQNTVHNSVFIAGTVTNAQTTIADEFNDTLAAVGGGIEPVIWSYKDPATFDRIVTGLVDPVLATFLGLPTQDFRFAARYNALPTIALTFQELPFFNVLWTLPVTLDTELPLFSQLSLFGVRFGGVFPWDQDVEED